MKDMAGMKTLLTFAVISIVLIVALAGCSRDGPSQYPDAGAQQSEETAVVEDVTSVTDELDIDEIESLESDLDSVDDLTLS